MTFDLGSVTAKIDLDVNNFKKGIQEVESGLQGFGKKLDNLGSNLKNVGQKLALTSAVVGGGLTLFLKDASEEAINFQRAMTTLDIIAGRFGVSGQEAKKAAEELGKELRIGVGPAAESIQNLLKSGLNLDQARDLLKRFTNEAITGKSPTISLSQAVQNLSFAYATNNSALGNLSGISENFNDIVQKGRDALIEQGMSADQVTDEMAKYKGMIDLTNLTLGSSEAFTGTLIDKQAELNQKIIDLKLAFGDLINPVLADLVDKIAKLVDWLNSLSEEKKKLILVIGFLIAAIGPLLIILGTLVSGISAVITIVGAVGSALVFLAASPIAILIAAVAALFIAWKTNFLGIQDQVRALWELIGIKFTEGVEFLKSIGGKVKDAIVRPFSEAFDRVKDIVNQIKEKLDFTKRNSPSIVDIVERGVDKVNNALMGLEYSVAMKPQMAAAAISNNTTGPSIFNVSVDMNGAIIADEYSAGRMSKMIGDNIIDQLKQNVRF